MKRITVSFICSILLLSVVAVCTGCKSSWDAVSYDAIERIQKRGTLLVGATGDYRPLSYLEPMTDRYWGFDTDLAEIIGKELGVKVQFVHTSWPTLTQDVQNDSLFDLAMCGITITAERQKTMLMSEGYLRNGKTILCRKDEAERYTCLKDINRPDVRVMVNPGGLNEKFAHEHLPLAKIVVHQRNEEIPSLIAQGEADVMITEIVEASYYTRMDTLLAAPLIEKPFTHSMMGVLMRKGDDTLLNRVNRIIRNCRKNGTLKRLHEKYGFRYDF